MIGAEHAAGDPGHLEQMGIDLTALIDIMFLLLIFFILTANSVPHALKLDLPEKGSEHSSALDEKTTLTLVLHEGGGWEINEKALPDWTSFVDALRAEHAANPDATVVVAGDRGVAMERLLRVLALLKAEGLAAAHILMQTPASGQETAN